MDIVQTPQNQSAVPSEAIGHSLADNRALPTVSGGQSRVSQPKLLVYLQTAEKGDERVRNNKGHLIPHDKA